MYGNMAGPDSCTNSLIQVIAINCKFVDKNVIIPVKLLQKYLDQVVVLLLGMINKYVDHGRKINSGWITFDIPQKLAKRGFTHFFHLQIRIP
jgi:hypothetical protein